MAKIKKKHPGGRPKWMPPDLEKVKQLAALGLSQEQIARALGISYQTLNERKKEFSEFAEAIKDGASIGVATIGNALYQNAKAGNTVAQIFFMKCRGDFKETVINDTHITFTQEDWLKGFKE
jgi:transcriptional regulator with XRE-family HTH domain